MSNRQNGISIKFCSEFKKVGVEYLKIMITLDEKKYIDILEFFCLHRLKSKSQIFQDLFVIYFTELKKKWFLFRYWCWGWSKY